MKTVLTFFFILSMVSLAFSQTASPDVIISSGEVIESTEGSISWTIGENLVETIDTTDLSLLQGYQEIEDTPVTIETFETENTLIRLFPTETKGIVISGGNTLNLPDNADDADRIHLSFSCCEAIGS
jgi:hypothetical protein